MTTRLIMPPAALAVSMADARIAARANGTDLDSEIEIQVRAITEQAEHCMQRSIINRTYRETLDRFPSAIRLPMPPVVSVTSVKYLDIDGVERTLDPADYIVDSVSEPGYIVPAYGVTWPDTYCQINAVNVVVVCGYGTSDASTPDAVKGYILAKVWEHFAPAGTPKSEYLDRGLDSLRVY
jgi:uncharacterized phiE125 gp8 family phage protein